MSSSESNDIGLSAEEIRRYRRHLILPEVGSEGQQRLATGRVLVVGLGGLGSPVSLYLAAAGVGKLGLVDSDEVEESNLHRQVLFGTSDIGRPKVDAAIDRLREVNPLVELIPHRVRLDASNVLDLIDGYDVIVDGSDNFPTRYVVNDACVVAGKPNVFGSVFQFEGQVSVFWGARGPCYRCLYSEPPPPELAPSCAEAGVLGVLPGVIGTLQATEAIKLLLERGDPLVGRLVIFDAMKLVFRELTLRKSVECPVCSEPATGEGLAHRDKVYTQPAQLPKPVEPVEPAQSGHLSPPELKERLEAGAQIVLLDVRTPIEHRIAQLPGGVLIPLPELPARSGELDSNAEIVVYCHHGIRSARACDYLRQIGFVNVNNLTGGIDTWSLLVDPSTPRY